MSLASLPIDILACVADFLTVPDLRNLRLTCRSLARKAEQPFARQAYECLAVSLEPNSIKVLQKIAKDSVYCRYPRRLETCFDDLVLYEFHRTNAYAAENRRLPLDEQHAIDNRFLVDTNELTAMLADAIRLLPNLREVEVVGNRDTLLLWDKSGISLVSPLHRLEYIADRDAPFLPYNVGSGPTECLKITLTAIAQSQAHIRKLTAQWECDDYGLLLPALRLMQAPSADVCHALSNLERLNLDLTNLTVISEDRLRKNDFDPEMHPYEGPSVVTDLFIRFFTATSNVKHLSLRVEKFDRPRPDYHDVLPKIFGKTPDLLPALQSFEYSGTKLTDALKPFLVRHVALRELRFQHCFMWDISTNLRDWSQFFANLRHLPDLQVLELHRTLATPFHFVTGEFTGEQLRAVVEGRVNFGTYLKGDRYGFMQRRD